MGEQSLAERLEGGPLSLPLALECIAEVAQALRDLHSAGQKHGQVNAAHVMLTAVGAELRMPEHPPAPGNHANDAMAMGALIFQMLTGSRPVAGGPEPWVPRVAGPRSNPTNIRASALRIARRSFAHPEEAEHYWAKDAAELRLLALMARQAERAGRKLQPVGGEVREPRMAALPPVETKREPLPPELRIEPAIPAEFLKAAAPAPVPIDRELPEYRRCPGCDSADVHDSKARTRMEKLASMALKVPLYRCHQCYHRWFLLFRIAIPCTVQKVQRRSF